MIRGFAKSFQDAQAELTMTENQLEEFINNSFKEINKIASEDGNEDWISKRDFIFLGKYYFKIYIKLRLNS